MKQEKRTMEQLKWLYRVNGRDNWRVVLLSLLNILLSAVAVGNILVLKEAIDGAANQNQNRFIQCVVLFVVLTLTQLGLTAGIRYFEADSSTRMSNNLRQYTFHRLLHGKLEDVNEYHSGALMGRLMGDSRVVSDQILGILPGSAGSLSRLAFCLLIMIQMNMTMSLVAALGGVVLFGGAVLWRDTLKNASRQIQQTEDSLRMFLKESIENITMIRSFSVEAKTEENNDDILEQHRVKRMHRATLSVVCNTAFGGVFRVIYLICFVWCGIELVNNRISYGTLVAALQLVNQIQAPVADLSNYIPKFFTLLVSVERLREITDLPQEPERMETSLGEFTKLHCENLSFGYSGKKKLEFEPITIHRGDRIAIRDQSGAGKSTFFKLLLQFYQPNQGGTMEVSFQDGTTMPISERTRSLFAYVPQNNLVLSGTIAENVGSVDGDELDMERIKRACELACADDFIKKLPNQYDQMIGERGLGLSEGQVQRLAIARAVYANRPILLLDEATSALDEDTEHRIIMNLKEKTSYTILLISHRKTSVVLCDYAVNIAKITETV